MVISSKSAESSGAKLRKGKAQRSPSHLKMHTYVRHCTSLCACGLNEGTTTSHYSCQTDFAYNEKMNHEGFALNKRSVFWLPCFSSKETLMEQEVAESCLIDYCRGPDEKETVACFIFRQWSFYSMPGSQMWHCQIVGKCLADCIIDYFREEKKIRTHYL